MEEKNEAPVAALTTKPKVIVFDVYNTLFDMSLVVKRVNDLLDNKRGYRVWFELFMQYCFVDNCTNRFNNFFSIADATFRMAGRFFGKNLTEEETENTLDLLSHLPLQENAQEGLSALLDQQFVLATLSNAPAELVAERMQRTGLISYFEKLLSAETIKKYKPCTEVYTWAAKQLGVSGDEVLFVSGESWDVTGAASAGMQTVYLKYSEEMFYPLAPEPTLTANSLEELAGQLSAFSDNKQTTGSNF